MGGATWSKTSYRAYSADASVKTRSQLFNQRQINELYDPKKVTVRESRDSEANPASNAIIVGLDVSGSMGYIAEHMAKVGLGPFVEGIHDSTFISDPHVMMMAIGDMMFDRAPLQVTQFEADLRIVEQLTSLWLEGGGGGNSYESYDLPWAFAAQKTSIDCFEKRGRKGYIFTIGDELVPNDPSLGILKEAIGVTQAPDKVEDLLAAASEMYHAFHIMVAEGSFMRSRKNSVLESWDRLMGKRAIYLDNYKNLSEVMLAVIEVNEGSDPDTVISKHSDPSIRQSVSTALYGYNKQG